MSSFLSRHLDTIRVVPHAWLLVGTQSAAESFLFSFVRRYFSIDALKSPDVLMRSYESLGIDESRQLREEAYLKPVNDTQRIFVIAALSMTHEAQHALLKLFEDAPPDTHFFLIMDSPSPLIPTLLSRLFFVDLREKAKPTDRAQKFLLAAPRERLLMIRSLVEAKDKEAARQFLGEIVAAIHSGRNYIQDAKMREALQVLEVSRGYLMDRSASLKLILEYISVALPVCPVEERA